MYTRYVITSSTELLATLRTLHQKRRRLLRRLHQNNELAVGTVSVVNRKCGKQNCRCATGTGHQQTLFLFKEHGRRRCKLVRREDEPRLQSAGENYRRFREDLKQLRAIDREEKQILLALAETRAIRYE